MVSASKSRAAAVTPYDKWENRTLLLNRHVDLLHFGVRDRSEIVAFGKILAH